MRTLTFILILLLAPRPTAAQSETTIIYVDSTAIYARKSGSLQFNLVNEVSAAWRWRALDTVPLRLKVDVSGSLSNDFQDDHRTYGPNDSLRYSSDRQSSRNYVALGLSLQYMAFVYHSGLARIHIAAGPIGSFSRQHTLDEVVSIPASSGNTYTFEQNDFSWKLGLLASVGLECRVYRNLTIVAEYHLTATTGWTSRDYKHSAGSYSKDEIRDLDMVLSSLTIGLGVYL